MYSSKAKYFAPLIIVIYFFVSNIPYRYSKGEVFPFYSFNLFSASRGVVEKYDVVFDQGLETEKYLYTHNKQLSSLERKAYLRILDRVGSKHSQEGKLEIPSVLVELAGKWKTAHLVVLHGEYIEAAAEGKYQRIEVLKQIK